MEDRPKKRQKAQELSSINGQKDWTPDRLQQSRGVTRKNLGVLELGVGF